MPPVDYLSGARRDFDESFDWYAARSPQAAVQFAAAVEAALAKVAANPLQLASSDGVHRDCPLKSFHFASFIEWWITVWSSLQSRILAQPSVMCAAHA